MDFRVYFNRRLQYFDVHLEDCHPSTFERRGGGRWGYWLGATERDQRRGLFGEMHFVSSRVRPDVVAHELEHVVIDRLAPITSRNDERAARLMDELTRNFWREYDKSA